MSKQQASSASWACGLVCLLAAVAAGGEYSWQKPHAKVLPTGDLAWRPEPFVFTKGASVRYVDFAAGRDDADGASKTTAWKHHPWDGRAAGQAAACSGVHTYVFKRGVVYRGRLVVRDAGRTGEPIRLTSDPSWGHGQAVLCGSQRVTGWKKGASHKDIPEGEKVWWADLDFAPRCVWTLDAKGTVTRIPLARTPNWKVSDPDDIKSQWWHWDYRGTKPFDVFTTGAKGRKLHLGVDTEHINQPADYYRRAIVWTEYGWVMGTPYPTFVETVDLAKKGLGFGGQWGGVGTYKIVRYNRYYLEDKPHYLDDPNGEFWFDKKGPGGRLYLRLPGDADPSGVAVEAARHLNLIDATRMDHVHVTGLTFRFTNVYWGLTAGPWVSKDVDPACIRLLGPGRDIRVANCLFEHVHLPVRMKAIGKGDVIDQVVLSDNDVRVTDHGAFNVEEGSAWGEVVPKTGLLHDVKVLRNRLRQIGLRPNRFGQGFAINILCPRTLEVAGNVLDRIYGGGINLHCGKRSGSIRDVPFCRVLVHHNRVTDPLLNTNDFGGIETWQGGPAYVYNNVSGNPGGYWHYGHMLNKTKPANARFGHAYYLDGAFKNYHFNNIAWGRSKDPLSRLGNTAAFQEIHSYQNTFFNNTVYNFVKGTRRQAPQAGRDKFLGNVWQGIGEWLFWHARPAKSPAEGNAADAGPQKQRFAHHTNACGRNVFHDVSDKFGVFEPSGRWHASLDSYRKAFAEKHALAADVGVAAKDPPLRDAAKHDFRPAAGSAAIDRGVRAFVPWALHAVVGEWNFTPSSADPTVVLDEHWYLTAYHVARQDYYTRPTYPLKGVHVGRGNYTRGPLEDWTDGAIRLNGRDQYLTARDADLARPFEYAVKDKRHKAAGEDLKSPQVHDTSFLVEVYFRSEPGHTGGGLVSKSDGRKGYELFVDGGGRITFMVRGERATSAGTRAKVNDGKWHHVLVERDRPAGALRVYLDGKMAVDLRGEPVGGSLANAADLLVGKGPTGGYFAGSIDFLRIALGTLKDASTTIEELYAWQFAGPQFRDFAGRTPVGRRDAGALESAAE